jgi:branched-chain amino acid transport system ATP-binding protein
MGNKQDTVAGRLNLIDRKRLEIARGLATSPKLLLLDEVFAGLNPAEIEEAVSLLVRIKESGITLIIVEHVMRVILGVSDRVFVMNYGVQIFDGLPADAINDEQVVNAYLGEDFHA